MLVLLEVAGGLVVVEDTGGVVVVGADVDVGDGLDVLDVGDDVLDEVVDVVEVAVGLEVDDVVVVEVVEDGDVVDDVVVVGVVVADAVCAPTAQVTHEASRTTTADRVHATVVTPDSRRHDCTRPTYGKPTRCLRGRETRQSPHSLHAPKSCAVAHAPVIPQSRCSSGRRGHVGPDDLPDPACCPAQGRCGTISDVARTPPTEQRLRDLALLRRVRDRIDRDYAQPLDVEALARDAHMSAGHLSRQFRLAYGESPYSYLMTRRIERAMALLRGGDHTVTEVCFAVGCSSLGTFSTRFTELVGMPPSTYRRRCADAADGIPACVAKQVTRPVRNREAPPLVHA